MQRFTMDLSDDIVEKLNTFAKKNNIKKNEAMRRAFALLSYVSEEKEKGHKLALVKEDENHNLKIVTKIVGIA